MNEGITIGTHDGIFHGDDVMAVAILQLVYPGSTVIRTRDPDKLAKCHFVVDVGGVYDVEKARFDHHQKGGAGERENGVQYSSAGLVWDAYRHVICGVDQVTSDIVDRDLIQPIDCNDNGQALYEGGEPNFDGVSPVTYSGIVRSMNPTWLERIGPIPARFNDAVAFATMLLERKIAAADGTAEARELTSDRMKVRKHPKILVLEEFHPWQEVAVEDPDVLYCVFPDTTGTWKVQCVPSALGQFENRKSLPEAWRGLSGSDLQKLTDVSDAVFCHRNGFICGAKTEEGATRLALMAIQST
jgi:uncharacterized UPF0160 family protein